MLSCCLKSFISLAKSASYDFISCLKRSGSARMKPLGDPRLSGSALPLGGCLPGLQRAVLSYAHCSRPGWGCISPTGICSKRSYRPEMKFYTVNGEFGPFWEFIKFKDRLWRVLCMQVPADEPRRGRCPRPPVRSVPGRRETHGLRCSAAKAREALGRADATGARGRWAEGMKSCSQALKDG